MRVLWQKDFYIQPKKSVRWTVPLSWPFPGSEWLFKVLRHSRSFLLVLFCFYKTIGGVWFFILVLWLPIIFWIKNVVTLYSSYIFEHRRHLISLDIYDSITLFQRPNFIFYHTLPCFKIFVKCHCTWTFFS